MSNVRLTIGGRKFTVACSAGEEAHVATLGAEIDSKVSALEGVQSQGESRMLLFAALLLADELHELRGARAETPPEVHQLCDGIAAAADRLEKLALHLEQAAQRS